MILALAFLLSVCPPEGRASRGGALPAWEASANILKNRAGVPEFYEPVSVPMVLAAPQERWTQASGGELEGYVIRTKLAETESCNCWDPKKRDVHVYVATSARVTDSSRMVICEISPRRPVPRPRPGTHVRIRGFFFYDAHHENERGRGTPWEIHPVTSIEEVR